MPQIAFWFEFGSTYSCLSALRIEGLAARHGVRVVWRPFLLGPIFAAQGWDTSPFNIYPAKGRYMWRDMERRAARLGLPFRRLPEHGPRALPQNGLHAARMALVGLKADWGVPFCKAVYTAQFAEERNIGDPEIVASIARQCGLTKADLEAATSQPIKDALRRQTETAITHGIFGAPSFITEGELYWGDARLEEALEMAARTP